MWTSSSEGSIAQSCAGSWNVAGSKGTSVHCSHDHESIQHVTVSLFVCYVQSVCHFRAKRLQLIAFYFLQISRVIYVGKNSNYTHFWHSSSSVALQHAALRSSADFVLLSPTVLHTRNCHPTNTSIARFPRPQSSSSLSPAPVRLVPSTFSLGAATSHPQFGPVR